MVCVLQFNDACHNFGGCLSAGVPDSNGCQFFVTTCTDCEFLDGKNVIVGQVIDGMHTISKIEEVVSTFYLLPHVLGWGCTDVAHAHYELFFSSPSSSLEFSLPSPASIPPSFIHPSVPFILPSYFLYLSLLL